VTPLCQRRRPALAADMLGDLLEALAMEKNRRQLFRHMGQPVETVSLKASPSPLWSTASPAACLPVCSRLLKLFPGEDRPRTSRHICCGDVACAQNLVDHTGRSALTLYHSFALCTMSMASRGALALLEIMKKVSRKLCGRARITFRLLRVHRLSQYRDLCLPHSCHRQHH